MRTEPLFDNQASIKVIGIGGAGTNAVNRMISAGVEGVSFVALNTDAQALEGSRAPRRMQLGAELTRGLGAGGDPGVGERAARESERAIEAELQGVDMVFITAGMGGGTGTGAAPVVAEIARKLGVLTVGVVTKPFLFEGPRRRRLAEQGAERLHGQVDTLITVPNDRLLGVMEKKASMHQAFEAADDVLRQGVQGISDIILLPGVINVDFADVRAVMSRAGVALMGLGHGIGDSRAKVAAQRAANSPLLETSIQGARRLLVNVTAGPDFSIGEIHEAMEYIQQFADADEAEIIMGHVLKDQMNDEVQITILAAGMNGFPEPPKPVEAPRAAPRETFAPRPFTERPVTPAPVASAPEPEPAHDETAAEPEVSPEPARPRPIEIDDLDVDIPTFLRNRRDAQ